MKKTFKIFAAGIALIGLSLVNGPAQAQTKNKAALEPIKEKAMLWEISGKGLQKPSYLFGTIHLICAENFEIKPVVAEKIKSSDRLVMELDFSNKETLAELQKGMMGEKPLSQTLSAADYRTVDSLVQLKAGAPLKNFDMLTLQTVSSLLLAKAAPCKESKSFEFEFLKIAADNKIATGQIERVTEQLDYLKKAYSDERTIADFKNYDQLTNMLTAMGKKYQAGELQQVYDTITAPQFMDETAVKYMLTERNHNWAERMPQMMEKETNFFAVGAAHLPGENGMIHLLRAKGYQVKPIFK
ncbi:hypothetical protein N180_03620 [Pedobacter antarcticus 4BY]|uniref:Polysaccharide biosynthesis protein GumN n=2 Tax=Pedobacter antarcticus TaxID=34086 RepID=A0A081PFI5_9SPHI|nr:TraB/GumN family protein [Pedobacter antarcticus]KEQ29458.1 hypothetical protein N180_03620 [Pedobacter antarcticus 4BY]SFF11869.1 hypothetical protein SAMN03003324_02474 [Pedobacter antarcticus]